VWNVNEFDGPTTMIIESAIDNQCLEVRRTLGQQVTVYEHLVIPVVPVYLYDLAMYTRNM
jgi:hypothetical protein